MVATHVAQCSDVLYMCLPPFGFDYTWDICVCRNTNLWHWIAYQLFASRFARTEQQFDDCESDKPLRNPQQPYKFSGICLNRHHLKHTMNQHQTHMQFYIDTHPNNLTFKTDQHMITILTTQVTITHIDIGYTNLDLWYFWRLINPVTQATLEAPKTTGTSLVTVLDARAVVADLSTHINNVHMKTNSTYSLSRQRNKSAYMIVDVDEVRSCGKERPPLNPY